MDFLNKSPKIYAVKTKHFLERTLKNGDRVHPPCAQELQVHVHFDFTLTQAAGHRMLAYRPYLTTSHWS